MAFNMNMKNIDIFGWVGLAVVGAMAYVFLAPKFIQPGPQDPVAPPASTAAGPPGQFGMGGQPFSGGVEDYYSGVAYTFPTKIEGVMPYGFRMVLSS
jgi:hypothetical protein